MRASRQLLKRPMSHTADPIPRNRPRGPSFCRITLTPCRTPRYFFTPSPFACNSPCSCNLRACEQIITRERRKAQAHRILTVSKLCVTVTAPQAAIPPAMNALLRQINDQRRYTPSIAITPASYPVVVDISPGLRAECAANVRNARTRRRSERDRRNRSGGRGKRKADPVK